MNTASGSEDDDPLREARAYNNSIYLMVAMPYLLLGAISFKLYRGYRSGQKQKSIIQSTGEEKPNSRPPG